MQSTEALNQARSYAEAGDNEKARLSLLESIKSDPHNQAALMMLAGNYFVSDMLNEAEMVFERLVLLSPGVGQVSIGLFNTLWKLERREEAIEEIRRFLQHADPDAERETIEQYQHITKAIEEGEL